MPCRVQEGTAPVSWAHLHVRLNTLFENTMLCIHKSIYVYICNNERCRKWCAVPFQLIFMIK